MPIGNVTGYGIRTRDESARLSDRARRRAAERGAATGPMEQTRAPVRARAGARRRRRAVDPFMVRYARRSPSAASTSSTFDFPYMAARPQDARSRAGPRRRLPRVVVSARGARATCAAARLFIGGKSMGGRIATHLAAAADGGRPSAPPLSRRDRVRLPAESAGRAERSRRSRVAPGAHRACRR